MRKLLIASTCGSSIAMIISGSISTTGAAREILRIGYRINNVNYRFSRILSSRGISNAVRNRMHNTYNSSRNDQFLSDEQDILFISDNQDILQCLRATFSLTSFVLIIPISSFERYNAIFYDTLTVSELANIFYSAIGLIYSYKRHGNMEQLSSYYRRTITDILISTVGAASLNIGDYFKQPLFTMVGATCIFTNYGYSLLKESTSVSNNQNNSVGKKNTWSVYRANFNTIKTLAYIDALVFERAGILTTSIRKGLPIAFEPLYIITEVIELCSSYSHNKSLSSSNKVAFFRTILSILITVFSVVNTIVDNPSNDLLSEIIDKLCWALLITPMGAFDIYRDSMSQYENYFDLSNPLAFFKRTITDNKDSKDKNQKIDNNKNVHVNKVANIKQGEDATAPLLRCV